VAGDPAGFFLERYGEIRPVMIETPTPAGEVPAQISGHESPDPELLPLADMDQLVCQQPRENPLVTRQHV
jgi:hypothetical protein